jgi:quinol monooxygenase YgiN
MQQHTLVILECDIKPGFYDEAARIMVEQLPDTRSFQGCHGINCYLERQGGGTVTDFVSRGVDDERGGDGPPDQGTHLTLIEYWDSLEAYHKYVSWRTERRDLPNFVEICETPPVLRVLDLMEG